MKLHSSKPSRNDQAIIAYSINGNIINMPVHDINIIKIFKSPAFKLIGIWQKKEK